MSVTPGPLGGREDEPVEGHVDPDLLPYIEAAREPDDESPQGRHEAALAALERREREDSEALALLAGSGLLGDVDALGDADSSGESDEDGDEDRDAEGGNGVGGARAHERSLAAEIDDDLRELQGLADRSADDARMQEVYEAIVARAPEHKVEPTLDRVTAVLDLLGAPHRAAPVVHVAGTNGKTSTARMIESLLRARGLRTGRYTSPHLHTARERIAIDGEPIPARAFVSAWEDVEPYVAMIDEREAATGRPPLSFFEVFTVMAFAAFADAPVDVVVLEVGMGGRWDATNVADGDIAVLTPIARDHQQWLGDTLTEIAGEKAGIVKDGAVVVSAVQDPEAAEVVAGAVARHRARLVREGAEIEVLDRALVVGGQLVELRTPAAVYQDVVVPLHGPHQAHNALLAVAAVEAFFGGAALDPLALERGLAAVTSPGRLEVLRSSPLVLVDAAHNPAGAASLREAVTEVFGLERAVGVVGVMADKEAEAMLSELEPMLDELVVTTIDSPRAMEADDLAEIARDVFGEERVHVHERLADALDAAVSLAEADGGAAMTHEAPSGQVMASAGVVVLGSVVLAAHAREVLGLRA